MQNEKNKDIQMIDQLVSRRLKQRRQALGLRLEDIANISGVSVQQIVKYENCTNRVPVGRLYYIAKFMKKSINYFFGE